MKPVVIAVSSGEQAKQIETVQSIWKALHKNGCDRKSLLINLGGGAICDVGGFAASTFMRGIDFMNIPTTLLAQVDASMGGKTGIDFEGVKNLVGTFSRPIKTIIDVDLLKTLPAREFIAGFAEIIKHGLIADVEYFRMVTSKHPLQFTRSEMIKIIARSREIKSAIVTSDPKEKGARKLLNFGHTVGHAIESLSLDTERPLLHGEAVAIGMVAEAEISESVGYICSADVELIRRVIEHAGLPTSVRNFSTKDIERKMRSDKKNEGGVINFTLLKKIGKAVINQTTAL
jgi:3-dehydroquinate synthase